MGRACVSWVGNKGICASPKNGRRTLGRRKINGTVDTGARCVLTQAFRPFDNAWMLGNKGGNIQLGHIVIAIETIQVHMPHRARGAAIIGDHDGKRGAGHMGQRWVVQT